MPRERLNVPWTAAELEELKAMLFKGKTLASMAVRFRRGQTGIRTKLRQLSLPMPEEVKQAAAERPPKSDES